MYMNIERRKPADQIKSKKIKIRMTESQYEYVKSKAAAAHMTVTDFVWASVYTKQVKGFAGKDILTGGDVPDYGSVKYDAMPCDGIKTKQVMIAVTQRQYEFMKSKAAAAHMTVTDFALSAVKAKKVGGFDD